MNQHQDFFKVAMRAGMPLIILLLAYYAYSRPGYFTSETYLIGLIALELVLVALSQFRKAFYFIVLAAFLFAGTGVPFSVAWTAGRWVFLASGAAIGCIVSLKEGKSRIHSFQVVALFCALAALASAAVSRYPNVVMLKALSLFLLFLYAATGARLAVVGREMRFVDTLVTCAEVLIAATALLYAVGYPLFGNPNSLGGVVAVFATPLLLWGALVERQNFKRGRRFFLYAISLYLVYFSHARAAILAAAFSSAVLCLAISQYRMLLRIAGLAVVIFAASFIIHPEAVSNSLSTATDEIVFKGFQDRGIFASRQSPWDEATASIRSHPWFGTGFGTTEQYNGEVGSGLFASAVYMNAEYGSSFLAILVWVGALGVLPFAILLLYVVRILVRTFRWIRATGSISHPAVPLAMLVVGGLVHAGFEDWLFAVGYYLCVLFWTVMFILADLAPQPVTNPVLRFWPAGFWHGEREAFVTGR